MKTFTLDLSATVCFRGIEANNEQEAIKKCEQKLDAALRLLGLASIGLVNIEEDED